MPVKNLEAKIVELTHAIGLLLRRRRSLTGGEEITMTESMVLARLERDGPATTAELARAESMKPQSMGTTVAALEQMGLLERRPHPTDRRQFLIQLSKDGRALRKSLGDTKRAWLTSAIAELDQDEQETLFKAGEIIRRLAEK